MADEELKLFYDRVIPMTRPEELFGQLTSTEVFEQQNEVKGLFRKFLRTYQVDKYSGNPLEWHMANEVCRKIVELHEIAKERISQGIYGTLKGTPGVDASDGIVLRTQKHEYHVFEKIAEGELNHNFRGQYVREDGSIEDVIVKIGIDSENNDLIRNEASVLGMLTHKHIPVLVEQFKVEGNRLCTVLRCFDGYDFFTVREHRLYKNGVPQKHMVWMLNRALSGIGFAHSNGILHGNINPAHLMIRPNDHNLLIADWTFALIKPGITGAQFKWLDEDFSAPEVQLKKDPLPSSDLYSIGKCMIYILGGNIKTNEMPDDVEPALQRFLRFFVMESPLQRAQDAWEMHGQLIELIEGLWGPRKFLVFDW